MQMSNLLADENWEKFFHSTLIFLQLASIDEKSTFANPCPFGITAEAEKHYNGSAFYRQVPVNLIAERDPEGVEYPCEMVR
jgi:hypothetical protein